MILVPFVIYRNGIHPRKGKIAQNTEQICVLREKKKKLPQLSNMYDFIWDFICYFKAISTSRATWSDCSPVKERPPRLATSPPLDVFFGGRTRLYKWTVA